MRIQQTWVSLIGTASTVIGAIYFIPTFHLRISLLDTIVHMITGLLFLIGAFIRHGRFVGNTNFFLGIFYILFGAVGTNWPHFFVGVISAVISLAFKPAMLK
jgi:hypothetical protein